IWGALFGAAAVVLLAELLRDLLPSLLGKTDGGEQETIVFGLILVAIMVFLPQGLTRGVLDMFRRHAALRDGQVVPEAEPRAQSLRGDLGPASSRPESESPVPARGAR
ncbi:MAG: hypothetical protein IT307_10430, partial [Chloroflexi bacterium]|nr:hypothetical protein [Chloroflexota bacterium]